MRDKNALWNIEDNQYAKCKRAIKVTIESTIEYTMKMMYNVVNFFVSTKRQFPSIRAGIPRQISGVARRDAARKFGFESERRRGVLATLAVAYKLQSKLF